MNGTSYLLYLLMFYCGAEAVKTGNVHAEDTQRMRDELDIIWDLISRQYDAIQHQDRANIEQAEVIGQQERTIAELKQTVEKQGEQLQSQVKTIESILQNNEVLENDASASGCLLDVINLECIAGRKINVTSALYGMYALPCNDSCCAPNPGDCSESAEESTPGQWAALKAACDNQTSCSYQYNGIVINECEPGYVADYMQINYDCWAESSAPVDPVAFTAFARNETTYNDGDPVLFESTITNVGGHYNADTSKFVCPYSGLYGFSIEFNPVNPDGLDLEIVRGDEMLVTAHADDFSAYTSHSSATVMVECDAAQEVSVRAGSSGTVAGGLTRWCHFSGFLLVRY